MNTIASILKKADCREPLSPDEIRQLLLVRDRADIEKLFETARNIRDRYFSNRVFLYGFLYISTYCSNNCSFCRFRRSNERVSRYRKGKDDILEAAVQLAAAGVHLIDLTMGQDLFYLSEPGMNLLLQLIRAVAAETGLPVMVSPGVVPIEFLRKLAEAGASWYACYQETYDRALFEKLRPGQDFHIRLESKMRAKEEGLLIEEGLLCGVGETVDGVIASLRGMEAVDPDQVRVMDFVPGCGIPLASTVQRRIEEPKIIALLRLLFPDRLIPASLDVEGLGGLESRLQAGANVVTSIVPEGLGLSGVAQQSLDIETGKRTVAKALEVAQACGLSRAAGWDYQAWIESRSGNYAGIDSRG